MKRTVAARSSSALNRVTLVLGFHAHQPVGNFPWVIDDAVKRCYRPFLEVAERHPSIRFSLHVSGWLLGELEKKYPSDVARIARMIGCGQVEMIGGGDTEPVLAAIPERDRREQLAAMRQRLQRVFGVEPRGAWLTERVWESSVVPALAAGGVRYTAVDDYHFLAAGRTREDLDGYFTTEEAGWRVDLFPIAQPLRYAIPFLRPRRVMTMLEAMPAGAAALYFDDLEKFGIWPDTFEEVYREGWLEEFLARLEASDRVETATFGEFHRRKASRGLIYLPTTSYFEMNAWTLPARGARMFEQLVHGARRAGTLERDKPHLRGGIWKNFLTKYPEANWMHKRVEGASRRFHALPRGCQTDATRAALHRAQANDAYWHGLFGGVYLPFLRASVYANLAELDAMLDGVRPRPPVQRLDIDLDGQDEIALRAGHLFAAARPRAGGSLCELTDYSLRHNFADVLARREEAYFAIARRAISRGLGAPKPPKPSGPLERRRPSRPVAIHERVAFKQRFKTTDLDIDHMPRGVFVDAWRTAPAPAATISYDLKPLERSSLLDRKGKRSDSAAMTLTAQQHGLQLRKTYRIERDALCVRYAITAQQDVKGEHEVRLDLAMPSAAGPDGWYVIAGKRRSGGLAAVLRVPATARITLCDANLRSSARNRAGSRLDIDVSPRCRVRTAPLRTVSRSEGGFEKIMQAATVTLSWPLSLRAGERVELSVALRTRPNRKQHS